MVSWCGVVSTSCLRYLPGNMFRECTCSTFIAILDAMQVVDLCICLYSISTILHVSVATGRARKLMTNLVLKV